jgi:hypothetical protein
MRRRIREDRGLRFEGLETTHYAKRVVSCLELRPVNINMSCMGLA